MAFVIELLLIGVGLSMDAFAVAVCKGLAMRKVNKKQAVVIGLFFGGFQALMPFIGWALGTQFESYITSIDHWIAFILLAFIGGKMVVEGYRLEEHFFMPGGEVSPEDGFVQTCLETAEKLHNCKEKPQAFGASCEQCFLVEKGSSTVICGPGSLDQAHTVDEFVEKAQVLKAAELYRQIALEILK